MSDFEIPCAQVAEGALPAAARRDCLKAYRVNAMSKLKIGEMVFAVVLLREINEGVMCHFKIG